jgi:hypothetical protein
MAVELLNCSILTVKLKFSAIPALCISLDELSDYSGQKRSQYNKAYYSRKIAALPKI